MLTAEMLTTYLDAPARTVAQALASDDRFPGAMELRHRVAAILGAGVALTS